MRNDRLELYTLPDYRPRKNKLNNYGYDPEEQRTQTYTGMGTDINVHDQWAVESLGTVQDRTSEHLGTTDKAIIANRKLLLREIDAIKKGSSEAKAPRRINSEFRGPVTIDTIVPAKTWQSSWRETAAKRREKSPWARPITSLEIEGTMDN